MSLPVLERPGRVPVFYSQRVDGRPFVNCLPYSICTVLRWMGYDVRPDPATWSAFRGLLSFATWTAAHATADSFTTSTRTGRESAA